jgi:hypothetical protein
LKLSLSLSLDAIKPPAACAGEGLRGIFDVERIKSSETPSKGDFCGIAP